MNDERIASFAHVLDTVLQTSMSDQKPPGMADLEPLTFEELIAAMLIAVARVGDRAHRDGRAPIDPTQFGAEFGKGLTALLDHLRGDGA